MLYKEVKTYLLQSGMCSKIEDIDGENVIVTTTLLQIEEVIRELYECNFKNYVVTIVDVFNVQIRTESVE